VTPGDGDGRISQEQVVRAVEVLKPAVEILPDLTWYEMITAMAFYHFAWEGVDVAVVEVGLGGRLDATNVIKPLVSVITSLSLDHTYLLGETLAEIAREKGGIIKPGVPVIVAPQESEAMEPLLAIARTQGAALTAVGRDWHYEPVRKSTATGPGGISTSQEIMITVAPGSTLIEIPSNFVLGLLGQHQQNNAVVALATLETVADSFPGLSMETISEGLANVEWPGRLQVLYQGPGKPTLLLDCAHNVDSAEKLAIALTHDFEYEDLWLVVGATVDKDVPGILKALSSLSGQIILTTSSHPRAAQPAELWRLAHEIGYEATSSLSVDEAVNIAWQSAGANDLICVTGSIFVVGDLLNHWESLQFDLNNRDQAYSGS
jgi:dihydrofolate synthase/folylpolyglutamate synthase